MTTPTVVAESPRITLRAMRWWDIEAVAAIDADVFGPTAWSVAAFWSELSGVPATRHYIVAVSDETVVGYAGVAFGPDDSDVQTIAVMPSEQRAGLGRRMMTEIIDAAVERGAGQLFLEVRHDNEGAIFLYRSLGFEQISVRKSYYAPGLDAVIMRLRLGQGGDIA
jgi:[ribosomal protein S18]-alanine N-acetyltransferase